MKFPPYLPCFHSPVGGLIPTPARICVPWDQGAYLNYPCIISLIHPLLIYPPKNTQYLVGISYLAGTLPGP